MSFSCKAITLFIFIFCFLFGSCRESTDHDGPSSNVEVVELEKYNTLVSYEEGILANPTILKYDGDSLLYVYDAEKKQVLALDESGEKIYEYGGQGRGPGELLWVNNIYLSNNYLYVIDPVQFRIARYTLDGELNSSLNYGQQGSRSMPPPAPQPLAPHAKDITNQPFVLTNNRVLLSNVLPTSTFNSLYTLVDWNGNHRSEIGDIPEGSAFTLDHKQYQAAVADGRVPEYYKANVFPVSDYASDDEVYFIYNAFPKIVKYNAAGEELWESDIAPTAEMDSIFNHFFEISEQLPGNGRIGLNTYKSGVSSKDGHLFLALGKYRNSSNSLWIHKFNTDGELSQRFRLISEGVNLAAIFDIDFTNQRIFVVTEEAEIRTYPF